ncbi:MAG: hypothetical protein KF709_12660 [Gemmatimonadaceae bacterium]|nr:hypothetical protein [Gemmatimonadaceae bacterium]
MTFSVRVAAAALSALIVVAVVLDPYSWNLNGSDARQPAPAIQLFGALGSIALQVLAATLTLRGAFAVSARVAAAEIAVAAGALAYLLWRDGYRRFEWGLGAQDFVWLIALAFAARILLNVALRLLSSGETEPSARESR